MATKFIKTEIEEYYPSQNIKLIDELLNLKSKNIISNLSINCDALTNGLYSTFYFRYQKIDGQDHNFELSKYLIELRRDEEYSKPAIFVKFPKINPKCNHIYEKNQLCLFHPDDFKWTINIAISETYITWTYMWLYFYEVWLMTNKWYGPEHNH